MSERLPFADLKFCNASLEEIAATPENGLIGYTARVSFRYGADTLEKVKEFPPAPESLSPQMQWFSDFQKGVGRNVEMIKGVRYFWDLTS